MATLNVALSDTAYEQLTAMARAQQLAPSDIIEGLLNQPFFELPEAQMLQVDEAIAELDRGEIATDEEAKAFFAQFAR